MDLKTVIENKRALLDLARDKVAELEQQISVLTSMLAEDDFDALLARKIKASESKVSSTDPHVKVPVVGSSAALSLTPSGRNPKGSIRGLLFDALAGGNERDLDYIDKFVNERAPAHVKRSALRTSLMNLKLEGTITSRKPGLFQMAAKGETPKAS